ncbi:MAG: rhodanese-like domain-containing protein [Synechococcaceae cyanobacterium]|nr:rhodanese-like domain-containing protein [Synechococcaceae cyanobacterium]
MVGPFPFRPWAGSGPRWRSRPSTRPRSRPASAPDGSPPEPTCWPRWASPARSGHIPGACNVPYLANIDPALATVSTAELDRLLASGRSFTFAAEDTLADLYRRTGVTPERDVITYCGRGYAGACGLLALQCLGHEHVRLYDGSRLEWSADPDLPVEKCVT